MRKSAYWLAALSFAAMVITTLIMSPISTAVAATQASIVVTRHTSSGQNQSSAAQSLSQLLSGYRTFQANFQQTTSDNQGRMVASGHGHVLMLRPGCFRWETTAPTHQIVTTNGKMLWIYDVDLAQASHQPLTTQHGFNPAELLSKPVADLKSQFKIAYANGWFELRPFQADPSFQLVRLQFKGNRLTGLQILNQLGQNNHFYFTAIQLNQPLSKQIFNFTPPKGVDVI